MEFEDTLSQGRKLSGVPGEEKDITDYILYVLVIFKTIFITFLLVKSYRVWRA